MQSYQTRRIVYGALAAALAFCAAMGWITQEISGTILNAVIAPLMGIGAGALGVATAKTHYGSDSRATEQDVVAARDDTTFTLSSLQELNRRVEDALSALGTATAPLPDIVDEDDDVLPEESTTYPGGE